MAELSFGWTSNGIGDGAAISVVDSAELLKALCRGSGVLRGFLNDLAPTVSGSSVLVNTGWGIGVTGHLYRNSSSKSTAITVPSLGTTGHRLVLRESLSAQTVRLYDISSADGTSSIPAATSEDTTIATFTITTGGAITLTDAREYATTPNPFDDLRIQFRANRRKIAEYCAQDNDTLGTSSAVGLGFYQLIGGSGDIITTLTGEPYVILGSSPSGVNGVFGGFGNTSNGIAVLAPARSPRWIGRVKLPAASANVTAYLAGFWAAGGGATANGAYIRVLTTGDVFFVTRQGGSETTTSLGTLSRTTLLGFEVESTDGGTTWVCRNAAGVVLATHTTNVPTAATALCYGVHYTWATATVPIGIAYQRVEATTP